MLKVPALGRLTPTDLGDEWAGKQNGKNTLENTAKNDGDREMGQENPGSSRSRQVTLREMGIEEYCEGGRTRSPGREL